MGPHLLHLEHPGPHSHPRRPNTAAPQVDPDSSSHGSALTHNGPARPARLFTLNGPAWPARLLTPQRPGPHCPASPGSAPTQHGAHGPSRGDALSTLCPGTQEVVRRTTGTENPRGPMGGPRGDTGRSHPAHPGCCQRPGLGRAPGFGHRAGHAWKLYIKQLHALSCLVSAARSSLIYLNIFRLL